MAMEGTIRYRSFSIIANLTELESFILHDPSAQSLYQQYLDLVSLDGKKANHIPFFADVVNLSERMSFPKAPSIDYFRAELCMIYEQYFLEESDLMLDIPQERLSQVRRNIERGVTLVSFKPAIKAVVRDLAFIYLDSFMNSTIFQEYKENVLVDFELIDIPQMAVKEKDSSMKLKKFFGDKSIQTKGVKNSTLKGQPNHIKEYKLSKIFGERVGVEKLMESDESREHSKYKEAAKRRDRKLHVFFGNYFEVEDTMYSERVRSRSVSDVQEYRKQPNHVKAFRLAKFFGARPPPNGRRDSIATEKLMDDMTTERHKRQHLSRFFGERMDPDKEGRSVTYATQPSHVKGCTLKKFFGESASHTLKFVASFSGTSNTWPACRTVKSRAKLEKIFGPYSD